MQSVQCSAVAKRFYEIFRRLHEPSASRYCSSTSSFQCFYRTRQIHTTALKKPANISSPLRHNSKIQLWSKSHWLGQRHHSTTPSSQTENEVLTLSTHIRKVMRHIPHPVVVITASEAPVESGVPQHAESNLRGMTASSFNTVALEPSPIVSFNVKTPSTTYDALSARGFFLVHFLSASPAGAKIADAFTKGRAVLAFEDLVKSKTVEVYFGKGTEGAPLLAGDGIVKVLRCQVLHEKCIKVGDHMVVLGEVVGIINPTLEAPENRDDSVAWTGLMYVDQRYRHTGHQIEVINHLEARPVQRAMAHVES